ncbi:sporulation protein YpjB [Salimicrobium halophilum]|uniref:Sporulation protein YpjB (SpoYpjB) n=1 Tax=Salimicrobium halophilum TaxID=86666 RepID=A0A1G8Q127_9BACI|nr:sporulation protein YpjB [Salimicrobium halophilum]SDI98454.1 Sporulation protein YpjB (SpoYpjB) [Salimicrobium halophilum]
MKFLVGCGFMLKWKPAFSFFLFPSDGYFLTGVPLDALLWTGIVIMGTIIVTLLYVGVKKYRAEKDKAPAYKQYKDY